MTTVIAGVWVKSLAKGNFFLQQLINSRNPRNSINSRDIIDPKDARNNKFCRNSINSRDLKDSRDP